MKRLRLFVIAALALATFDSQAQYCMLPGRTTYAAEQPGITNFKLNTIDRTSGNVEQPMTQASLIVTDDTTELALGKTYTVEITHTRDANFFPNARNNVRLWIDYDQNIDFTGTDETAVSADYETFGKYTATFTVPMTAKLGYTRLRVTAKMSDDAGHTVPTPCDEPKDPIDYHGEIEDYVVNIVQFPTSIENTTIENNIVVAPNPTTGIINVGINSNDAVVMTLLDLTGKVIANPVDEANQSKKVYTIDLNNYVQAQGIYLLKVTTGGETRFEKIIKTN